MNEGEEAMEMFKLVKAELCKGNGFVGAYRG